MGSRSENMLATVPGEASSVEVLRIQDGTPKTDPAAGWPVEGVEHSYGWARGSWRWTDPVLVALLVWPRDWQDAPWH